MSSDPLSQPGADARVALLERDGDLALLGALLAAAQAGEGRLVVIEGPAGIGKTRLLDEARAAADGLGLAVLHARGGEERDFGFGVVRQLLSDGWRSRRRASAPSCLRARRAWRRR